MCVLSVFVLFISLLYQKFTSQISFSHQNVLGPCITGNCTGIGTEVSFGYFQVDLKKKGIQICIKSKLLLWMYFAVIGVILLILLILLIFSTPHHSNRIATMVQSSTKVVLAFCSTHLVFLITFTELIWYIMIDSCQYDQREDQRNISLSAAHWRSPQPLSHE